VRIVVSLQPRIDELLDAPLLLAIELLEDVAGRQQKLDPPSHAGA
jgi:hypothetical protein